MTDLEIANELLLKHDIVELTKQYTSNRRDYANSANNIFSIVTKNYHHENFHSDILQYLLSPNLTKNNQVFELFIQTLNNIAKENKIDCSNYQNISVKREYSINKKSYNSKGRIDILISSKAKNAIIIESKINNATDQENQLQDYYQAIKDEGFNVDAIVYLSFDGKKKPAEFENYSSDLKEKLILMAAVGTDNSIMSWIGEFSKTLEDDKNQVDLYSLIYQYKKLLQHMSKEVGDLKIKQEFFNFIKKEDKSLNSAYMIKEIMQNFDEFLLQKVKTEINELKHIQIINEEDVWYYIQYEKNGYTLDISRNSYDVDNQNLYLIYLYSNDKSKSENFIKNNSLEGFEDSTNENPNWHYLKKYKLPEFETMIDFLKKIIEKINSFNT